MRNLQSCPTWQHAVSRRQILGGLTGATMGVTGGLGFGQLLQPAVAESLKQKEKQVLLIWLDGGMSQLESWDPKPNTQFGGPYRSIPTKLPGVQISELMPKMAERMDRLSIVRSMKTEDPNHSSGVPKILRGQPKNRGVVYPYFGSAVAKLMGPCASGMPPYVWVKPGSGGFIPKHAGFLGAKYGALAIGEQTAPPNLLRPESVTAEEDKLRNALREKWNRRYALEHRQPVSESHSHVYELAHTLQKRAHLFDDASLSESDKERYGTHDLGKNLLLARRLLESGVRFVHVTSYGWDTHGDNFNAHASRMPTVDQGCSAILDDLRDRGMMDHVLVIIMAEFGRTPRINGSVGRDHWPNAWSLAMAGTGIKPGVVEGATNAQGSDVITEPHDIGAMFHTWYRALGIDSKSVEYHNGTQPLPIAHDDMHAVESLLA